MTTTTTTPKKKWSRLSDRWTEAQKEIARSISNDISENIDNKDTRAELRMAVAIYADWYSDEIEDRSARHVELVRLALDHVNQILKVGRAPLTVTGTVRPNLKEPKQ